MSIIKLLWFIEFRFFSYGWNEIKQLNRTSSSSSSSQQLTMAPLNRCSAAPHRQHYKHNVGCTNTVVNLVWKISKFWVDDIWETEKHHFCSLLCLSRFFVVSTCYKVDFYRLLSTSNKWQFSWLLYTSLLLLANMFLLKLNFARIFY